MKRAELFAGILSLRIEDIDKSRSKKMFLDAMIEDMTWFGLRWCADIVVQSSRKSRYLEVWRELLSKGLIYPSPHSRKDGRCEPIKHRLK